MKTLASSRILSSGGSWTTRRFKLRNHFDRHDLYNKARRSWADRFHCSAIENMPIWPVIDYQERDMTTRLVRRQMNIHMPQSACTCVEKAPSSTGVRRLHPRFNSVSWSDHALRGKHLRQALLICNECTANGCTARDANLYECAECAQKLGNARFDTQNLRNRRRPGRRKHKLVCGCGTNSCSTMTR